MAKALVNRHGKALGVVEDTLEAIKASDLLLLMDVVRDATGLYNALERALPWQDQSWEGEWADLGTALRALGLNEVQP